MAGSRKKIDAVFYRSANGSEPVRDWLMKLTSEDRRIIGFDIATAEFGWPVGMPLCRSLGDGLWEIRSDISHGNISRVIFCIAHRQMVLLHGFVKKSQKTPQTELKVAHRRQRSIGR